MTLVQDNLGGILQYITIEILKTEGYGQCTISFDGKESLCYYLVIHNITVHVHS